MADQDGQIVQGDQPNPTGQGGANTPAAGSAATAQAGGDESAAPKGAATVERSDADALKEILGTGAAREPAPWDEPAAGEADQGGEGDEAAKGDGTGEADAQTGAAGDQPKTSDKAGYATEQGGRPLPPAYVAPALTVLRMHGYSDAELETMTPGELARRTCAVARDALGRSGVFEKDELDSMNLSTLLSKGLKQARVQANRDADYRDLTRLRRDAASTKQTTTRPGTGDTTARGSSTAAGRSGRANSSVSDRPGTDPQIVERYTRLIDESVVDPRAADELRGLARELVNASAASQQETRTTEASPSAIAEEAGRLFNETAQSLSEQFPALKTHSGLQAMVTRMNRLDPDGFLVGDPKAFLDRFQFACELEFGRDSVRSAQTKLLERSKANADGQPSRPKISTTTQPMTRERYDAIAARAAIESNGDEELFKRMMAKVPVPAQS
ncbi:hypothetical protein [Tolypothrix sp. VBCCA 56010]|uniref:hypothetical protein n=1 Tax=Tolypothrix sp. VBCCA 56010 TaxID=3137731 RepID=UPI003D7C5AC8